MVVYLPSALTQRPVLASFLKGGSEDTLSVSGSKTVIPLGSRDVPLATTPCPWVGIDLRVEKRQCWADLLDQVA